MKRVMLALILMSSATAAMAQPFPPGPPGYPPPGFPPPGPPHFAPPGPGPGYGPGPDHWREGREDERDWRRRAEFREAEHRRWEWRRDHCVRDWQGREFCR